MGRRTEMAGLALVVSLALLGAGCGGGGGGGSNKGGSSQLDPSATAIPTGPAQPTATPTPLGAVGSDNQRIQSSSAGSITLRIQNIDILEGDTTAFRVLLADSAGHPVSNQEVAITTDLLLLEPQTIGTGGGIVGTTGADGSFSGSLFGGVAGRHFLTVGVMDASSALNGLSVTLTVVVHAGATPTSGPPTQSPTPPSTPIPTPTWTPSVTPTPEPCAIVQTIIVQTDTPNVSSQTGGSAKITAIVFDANNIRVPRVAILFDVQPRNAASFSQLVQTTDDNGTAVTTLNIPANSSFGPLAISAQACGKTGGVSINVVSGVSTKPVATVVLQADPSTVGNLSGGTVNLTAAVFDADNGPINGIDVLFITPVGQVNPLTNRTRVTGSQSGITSSVLQIPVGTPEGKLAISAVAEGVSGSTSVTVVPGRVLPGGINPGVPPGEPAAITLGASPTHIQVAGTGGTELATVVGRVFDNNGNPLSGINVHYHVVTAASAPGAAILPVTTPVPTSSPTPVPTTLCAADDPVSVSDVAGFAVIQVHAGAQPGPITIAACTDTTVYGVPAPINEQQTLVTVSSGPASHVSISISSAFSDNNDGTLLTMLSASVTDGQGNPVEDGTGVFFRVLTSGADDPAHAVVLSGSAVTDSEPPCDTAQYVVQTGVPISPQPGNAIACVKYPLALQATEIQVQASVGVVDNMGGQGVTLPGAVGDLEVQVVPATVRVDNTEDAPALVRARVFDASMDPVQNVRVRFITSIGTIDQSVLSDSDGQASATLVIPAGTESGTATVRVAGGGFPTMTVDVPIVNTGGASGTPTPGSGGGPGAMHFVGAQPVTIGVRGSGLPEQSVLTFQVTDTAGSPLAGVTVSFSIARVADEQISPVQAVTDDAGNVQVTITSGRRAMSLQVTAEVDSVSPPLVVRSAAVSILGGPPSQPNFSLAHQLANVSGGVFYGTLDTITAFVADRFGNPVPPGTAVNFTTKGGAIGNPTTTSNLGQATATLVTQAPVPDNGIVVTLATTRGERPFIDVNGNGVCDGADQLLAIPEPFYDANCNGVHDPGEDFIDLNDDGVFNSDQGSGTPACGDQVVVSANICTTFSGPTSVLLIPDDTGPVEPGGSRNYTLIVSDNADPIGNPGVGNPIVGGSKLAITTDGSRARVVGLSDLTLPDTMTFDRLIDGVNRFHFTVLDKDPESTKSEVDVVTVAITSDVNSLPGGGNGSVTVSDLIPFLAMPTPTPTITASFTPTATPTQIPSTTPTPQPPLIVPTQSILAAGDGAPPNGCTGATQTFVVTGGSPPFAVYAGGGCVSVASVPASGGSFIFTAGNGLGNFTITVTDAAGKTASAGVTVQGPPTPPPTPTPIPTSTVPAAGTATATATPPPGSIQFLGATPSSIGVRGSGLPEQSTLVFKVNSVNNNPIPGVAVQFTLSGTGSESLNPGTAVSDQNGLVSTAVTSGTQATTVRVIATLVTNPGILAQSTAVSILGAPPAFNHFSMAANKLNIQGRVLYGLTDQIEVYVNDRFGNAVPPGTAVSFVTNAASVVNPTTTGTSGVATATLLTEGLVPPSGIVTVMAYTHGEESFIDNNGNGIFDAGDTIWTDDIPEPFIDFRPAPPADAGCSVPAPSWLCNDGFDLNTPFELFLDTNGNHAWDSVTTTGIGQGTHGVWDNNILVFDTFPVTFSGPTQPPVLESCSPGPCSGFHLLPGQSMSFTIDVHDDLVNPLVGGSTIAITASNGTVAGGSITVPDGESFNQLIDGLTRFSFLLSADSSVTDTKPTTISVTITSPNGSVTSLLTSGVVGP